MHETGTGMASNTAVSRFRHANTQARPRQSEACPRRRNLRGAPRAQTTWRTLRDAYSAHPGAMPARRTLRAPFTHDRVCSTLSSGCVAARHHAQAGVSRYFRPSRRASASTISASVADRRCTEPVIWADSNGTAFSPRSRTSGRKNSMASTPKPTHKLPMNLNDGARSPLVDVLGRHTRLLREL